MKKKLKDVFAKLEKSKMGLLYRPWVINPESIFPKEGEWFSLEEQYEHLDCETIQGVFSPNGKLVLIMDEEAAITKASAEHENYFATRLVEAWTGLELATPIFGNVIVRRIDPIE